MLLVLAQAAAPAATIVAPAPSQQGIISYPQSFFADQHPGTALDMVNRLPGFVLDAGSSVRGYEGAAGNVLIDGRRPTTKTDALDEILKRLPAGQVERIDVIRGGAPGVDMQGKSVLANVIRKAGAGFRGLVAVADNHVDDGRDAGAIRIEGSGAWGARKWEFGSLFAKGIDDGAGDGPGFHVFADGRPRQLSFINTDADLLEGQLTGAVETPLLGGTAQINGRWYRDKYKYDEQDRILAPTPGQDASVEYDRKRETELGANYTRSLGPDLNLELVALRHPRDLTIDSLAGILTSPERFQLARHTVETIGRAVVKYQASDQLSLEGGAESAVNTLDSRTGFTQAGVAAPLPAGNVRVREDRDEAFAKAAKLNTYVRPWLEWRPRPDLNLRLELDNATVRNSRRTDLIWPGPRSAGGAPDIEDRNLSMGRMYYLRIRKTFGG